MSKVCAYGVVPLITGLLHRMWDLRAINVLFMCLSAYQQLKNI